VITVAVVMLIGLLSWYGSPAARTTLRRPTDHEAVHQLAERWRARWPQVPGPAERYLDDALLADLEDRPQEAARRTTMALALAPNDVPALLRLVIRSARVPSASPLTRDEADAILMVVEQVAPEAPLREAAIGWRALARGEAVPAEGLGDAVLEASWLRMRQALDAGADPGGPARALIEISPGHVEACDVYARALLRRGELRDAAAVISACRAVRPQRPRLSRTEGDLLDRLGHHGRAVAAYTAGGAHLHALAVASQEGLTEAPALLAQAAGEVGPAGSINRLWATLLLGGDVSSAVSELVALGDVGPEFGLARAAGHLALGQPQAAQAALDGRTDVGAQVLIGRARALSGDHAGASAAFRAALDLQPWNMAIHRQRAASLVGAAAGVEAEALAALAALDPVAVALRDGLAWRLTPWPALASGAWPTAALEAAALEVSSALSDGPERGGVGWWRRVTAGDPTVAAELTASEHETARFLHARWLWTHAAAPAEADTILAQLERADPDLAAVARERWALAGPRGRPSSRP